VLPPLTIERSVLLMDNVSTLSAMIVNVVIQKMYHLRINRELSVHKIELPMDRGVRNRLGPVYDLRDHRTHRNMIVVYS
jgi:hypothetical protein